MADFEGKNPDFDDLDLPSGDLPDIEVSSDPTASGESDAGLLTDEDLAAEPQEEEAEEALEEKGGLLRALGNASPYTVMLGLALLALLIAVTCLLMEWGTYGFDFDASDYQQRAR